MKIVLLLGLFFMSCHDNKVGEKTCIIMLLSAEDKLLVPAVLFCSDSTQKTDVPTDKIFYLKTTVINQINACVLKYSDTSTSKVDPYTILIMSNDKIVSQYYINNKTQLLDFFECLDETFKKNKLPVMEAQVKKIEDQIIPLY